jgi:hypothetical protein
MDTYTTLELADKLQELADRHSGTDKGLLLGAAHLLRLYGSIEQIYRMKLGGEVYEIAEAVNNLFKKSHTG